MAERDDEMWMRIALAQAEEGAAAGEVPVGAVLVGADGEELARGHNAPRKLCDPTAHAEILTIRRAAQRVGANRLPGTTLYATLEPCALCLGGALQARVKRIVFGAFDPKGGAAGSVVDLTAQSALNHRIETRSGVLEGACAAVLRTFFAERRKK